MNFSFGIFIPWFVVAVLLAIQAEQMVAAKLPKLAVMMGLVIGAVLVHGVYYSTLYKIILQ